MKRYDPIQLCDMGGHASGQMEENTEGDYVLYDDARCERQDLVDTIEACLIAAGGSPVVAELEEMCREAGTKPSDFVKALKRRKDNLERLVESMYHHYGEDSTFADWMTTMANNIENDNAVPLRQCGTMLRDKIAMAALTGLLARETLYSNVAANEPLMLQGFAAMDEKTAAKARKKSGRTRRRAKSG